MLNFAIRITPIPRLTVRRLEDLILRREDPRRAVCFECETPAMVLVPRNGRVLCEDCDRFALAGIRR